jgi:uncharacterized protein
MKFSLADHTSGYAIQGYGPGEVTIGGRLFRHSLVLTPTRLEPWHPAPPEQLDETDLAPVIELAPELLLLGTGPRQRLPSPALYAALAQRGIALEAMDNGAACRTYNILLAEGRRIALALFLG